MNNNEESKNKNQAKKQTVNELENLKLKNQELTNKLNQSCSLIDDLKVQLDKKNKHIDELNRDFVNIINQKALIAQKQLDAEIKKMQDKFEKDLSEKKKYALTDSLVELLSIISKFDLAISQENTDPKINNFLAGFKMFSTMFKTWLNSIGVQEIIVKVGDKFNPEIMEAIDIETKAKQKNALFNMSVLLLQKINYCICLDLWHC